YFFDEEDGIYYQFNNLVIPNLHKDFSQDIAKGGKIRGQTPGGVSFYRDGAKFFGAHQAAMLLIESGIGPKNIEIVVNHRNNPGLKQGEKGFYGIDWFIKGERPLTKNDKLRVKRHFDFTDDGRLRVKPQIRKTIRTISKRSYKLVLKPGCHFILYNFVEYRLEYQQGSDELLKSNLIAGAIINNLMEGGYLVTTAEKWFPDDETIYAPLGIPAVMAYGFLGDRPLAGRARVYKKSDSTIDEKWLDSYFENELKETVRYKMKEYTKELKILDAAYLLAKEIHGKQKRANGRPYIIHLFAAIKILITNFDLIGMFKIEGSEEIRNNSDEIMLAIAMLHDAIEDYKGREDVRAIIRNRFEKAGINSGIIDIILESIEALTKKEGESDEDYQARLLSDGKPYLHMIKMADRLHNIMTPRYKRTAREVREYLKLTMDFVNGVKDERLNKAVSFFKEEVARLYTSEIDKQGLSDPAKNITSITTLKASRKYRAYSKNKWLYLSIILIPAGLFFMLVSWILKIQADILARKEAELKSMPIRAGPENNKIAWFFNGRINFHPDAGILYKIPAFPHELTHKIIHILGRKLDMDTEEFIANTIQAIFAPLIMLPYLVVLIFEAVLARKREPLYERKVKFTAVPNSQQVYYFLDDVVKEYDTVSSKSPLTYIRLINLIGMGKKGYPSRGDLILALSKYRHDGVYTKEELITIKDRLEGIRGIRAFECTLNPFPASKIPWASWGIYMDHIDLQAEYMILRLSEDEIIHFKEVLGKNDNARRRLDERGLSGFDSSKPFAFIRFYRAGDSIVATEIASSIFKSLPKSQQNRYRYWEELLLVGLEDYALQHGIKRIYVSSYYNISQRVDILEELGRRIYEYVPAEQGYNQQEGSTLPGLKMSL
ncbi:MAG: hypothetical protein KKB22_08200, partial [Candidatus Omnitrophica bacterium]|nr:hypothetical protein [Candidatus Omnitrophota bacterium]